MSTSIPPIVRARTRRIVMPLVDPPLPVPGRVPALVLTLALALGLAPATAPAPAAAAAVGPAPAITVAPPSAADLVPGLTVRLYAVGEPLEVLRTPVPDQSPNADVRVPVLDLTREDFARNDVTAPFVTEVTGWLRLEAPWRGTFELTSDDGSRLAIGGEIVIDHDGRHGPTARRSAELALPAGLHPLRIDHFDAGGNRVLRLAWRPEGTEAFVPVPPGALRTERDLTRVTAPGLKRLEGGRRPGDGVPLVGVHPMWRLETIRPEGFEPLVGAMLALPDGRLLVGTFDPLQRDDRSLPDIDAKRPDSLWAVTGWETGDPGRLRVEEVASGLYEPAGLARLDGEVVVGQRRQVTRLRDRDGDGRLETHERVARGWEGWNYHQFTFCPVPGPDPGRASAEAIAAAAGADLHVALSTAMAPPAWEGMETNAGPNGPLRGSVLGIDADTGETWVVAGGTRTPNGMGLGPGGELLYSDNQGTWFPTSVLSEVVPGRFFGHFNWTRRVPRLAARFPEGGHPSVWADRPVAPPAVVLPHGEASNSPTVPLALEDGPFAGQLLLGELTAGGLRRISLQRVDGQLQGAVYRHAQGFESGVNRLVRAPDGSLLVGGIGAGGNWNWRETRFGLQRLVPTGETAFEMHEVVATPEGFRITFTRPVDRGWLADPRNHELRQWRYVPTAAYGGPKVDEEPLEVAEARPSGDGRSVELVVPGRKAGRCVHLRIDARSTDGEAMWSPEAWYTLNRIPRAEPPRASTIAGAGPGGTPLAIRPTVAGIEGRPHDGLGVGVLPPPGAVPLVTRTGTPLMTHRGRPSGPGTNRDQDALMEADPWVAVGAGSGDLVSDVRFGDARLHVEWHAPPGGTGQLAGNSGVYLQDRYELQVLGTLPGDAPPAADEAGGLYALKAADRNASTGPGTWQAYDVFFRAPRFAGGEKVADARITVYWNGALVHDDVAIPRPTGAAQARGEAATPGVVDADGRGVQLGPLRLQDHASAAEGPVRYRNVWIAPIDPAAADPGRWTAGPWTALLEQPEDAWMIRGGQATFTIDRTAAGRPVLIGRTVPDSPNTFFTTVAEHADFELVYEATVDPELNSGVQVRSAVLGGTANRAGGLAGPQIELDPSGRAWSGGVFDERGRGWLHPLDDAPWARRAFRPGQWNRFRVVARGPVIETWINGVPAATVFDAVRRTGHVGFQVHGVGGRTDPLEVRFRDVRIRPLTMGPPAPGALPGDDRRPG